MDSEIIGREFHLTIVDSWTVEGKIWMVIMNEMNYRTINKIYL